MNIVAIRVLTRTREDPDVSDRDSIEERRKRHACEKDLSFGSVVIVACKKGRREWVEGVKAAADEEEEEDVESVTKKKKPRINPPNLPRGYGFLARGPHGLHTGIFTRCIKAQ